MVTMNRLENLLVVALLAAPGATQEPCGERREWTEAPSSAVAAGNASSSTVSTRGDDPKRIAQDLKSKDEEKVRRAVEELAALGSEGVPYLADALEFEGSYVRREALLALGKLGDTAGAALPKLVAHSQATGTLGEASLTNMIAKCTASELWSDSDPRALAREIGLTLSDDDLADWNRIVETRLCVQALARVGEAHFAELLGLVAPLARGPAPNEFTGPRLGVAFALRRSMAARPDETLVQFWPLVERSLSAEKPTERMTALLAVAALDKPKKGDVDSIAPAVAARLKSGDALERALASAVLAQLDPSCDAVGVQLEPLLADPAPYARVFAAVALREICGGSPAVEDVLFESLSADDETRAAALESIHSGDHEPSDRAIGPMTKCLDSKNEHLLVAALDALRSCGERGKGAAAKIKTLTKHKNGFVRRAADSALKRIR
jgi:hypothetical protein